MADKLPWSLLSGSSQRALEWASTQANDRVRQSPAQSSGITLAEISAPNLLVGILQAHPQGDTAPHQLLQHFSIPLEKLFNSLDFAPQRRRPESLQEMPPLDREAERIITESFSLAREYNLTENGLVRLRDLFGGILTTSNEARNLLQQLLQDVPIQVDPLASSYPEFLRYPSKEMSYGQFLAERYPLEQFGPERRVEPLPSIRFAVSGFDADIRTDEDLVGIGAEVDAFAYLIAAKNLKPPLAIGLFGDWGSGKSFFMESLRRRIHKITEDARRRAKPQKEISIFKSVVQIEFNAWHYVEGNLWASLVEHIFRNLQTRPGEGPTLLQQRQQFWINKIDEARRKQQVAQELKIELENQLSEKQAKISELEAERDEKLEQLTKLQAEDVAAAIELPEADKKRLKETLHQWGITQTSDSVAELIDAFEKLRTELRRGNTLITLMRQRGWLWTLGLILVVLSGPAISLFLIWISQNQLPAVTNVLVSVSAFLSGLTLMLKWGVSRLSNAIDQIEQDQFELDQKRRDAEKEYAQKIAAAKQAYAAAQAAYEQAKSEEEAIVADIKALEQELQRITPGRVLLDFINERVGSEDYRKHLGITALIRRDFDQLSQLIEDQNKEFIAKDKGKKQKENQHLMNRIVLYIDDLDRCPPQRVVEVLQAVHLLLAFPLFVVVVAVDARWLSQSLQKHYEDLLTAARQQDGLALSEGFARQATPQDYLEKIFQVSFWIRPLPASARLRLVQGLVADSLTKPSASDPTHRAQTEEPKLADDGQPRRLVEQRVEDERPTWTEKERERPLKLDIETDLTPPSLEIQLIELQFIKDLQTLLGRTPRSVKRFVNVYRLIKAMSLAHTPAFVNEQPLADFKLVLFLLAVLTGLPAISPDFFRLLRQHRSEVKQVRESQDLPAVDLAPPTLAEVFKELRRLLAGEAEPPLAGVTPIEPAEADETKLDQDGIRNGHGYEQRDALQELELLKMWVQEYDQGRWLTLDAALLADWLPQVGRFSFRFEEL